MKNHRVSADTILVALAIFLAGYLFSGFILITFPTPADIPAPPTTTTAPPRTVTVMTPGPTVTVKVTERASRSVVRQPSGYRYTVRVSTPAKRYAVTLLNARQWPCLHELWMRESGWSPTSRTGSHFGIAQRKGETSTDYRVQVDRGLSYISNRYGTPCAALAAHNSKGWY